MCLACLILYCEQQSLPCQSYWTTEAAYKEPMHPDVLKQDIQPAAQLHWCWGKTLSPIFRPIRVSRALCYSNENDQLHQQDILSRSVAHDWFSWLAGDFGAWLGRLWLHIPRKASQKQLNLNCEPQFGAYKTTLAKSCDELTMPRTFVLAYLMLVLFTHKYSFEGGHKSELSQLKPKPPLNETCAPIAFI